MSVVYAPHLDAGTRGETWHRNGDGSLNYQALYQFACREVELGRQRQIDVSRSVKAALENPIAQALAG